MSSVRELEVIKVTSVSLLFELINPFASLDCFKTALSPCYHVLLF